MTEPYPKAKQLARGARRYPRLKAGKKEWAAIRDEKGHVCRLYSVNARLHSTPVEYHHLVPRSQMGDDVAANLVPLCGLCHSAVTRRSEAHLRMLAERLTDAEYAYVVGKLGENAMGRLFGV